MLKSGLIVGGVALVLGFLASTFSPVCASCVALFAGLGAGFLASVFDKPTDQGASAKLGAYSGAIASVGVLLGTALAAVASAILVGPAGAAEGSQQLAQLMGLPTGGLDPAAIAANYYTSLVGISCCVSVFNIALMAGLGALGGILWLQTAGKKNSAPTP